MEIATYIDEGSHRRLGDALRTLGFNEAIPRYQDLPLEEAEKIRVIFGWGIPQSVMDACPRLQWIQGAGAGVDWSLALSMPDGITLTRIVDHFGPDMGEYALLSVLAWVKDWQRLHRQQEQKLWGRYLVGSLQGLAVGVLGAGSIGTHIARVFQPLVREVRALGRRRPEIGGVKGYSSLEWVPFYGDLDVLIMVLPLTPDTLGLVGQEQLSLMKQGSFLVNVGRGAVLNEDDFVKAVQSRHLSGGALDVFSVEPLPKDSPLWELPGVTLSPHISGPSRADGMAAMFLDNLRRFREGRPLRGVVDGKRGY